jgi:hypothetical protein
MRRELKFNGQTAIQIFDGANGWRLRPYLNRREVEPYTADELKAAYMQSDLDGPLVDYMAKGSSIELVGMDKVENKDTYNLRLRTKTGRSLYIWIDATPFLKPRLKDSPESSTTKNTRSRFIIGTIARSAGCKFPFFWKRKVLPIVNTGTEFSAS